METTNEINNANGYAVVYFDGGVPKICNGVDHGVRINGRDYCIYEKVEDAVAEFRRWPHGEWDYGILPMRLLVEERPRFVVKDSALEAV